MISRRWLIALTLLLAAVTGLGFYFFRLAHKAKQPPAIAAEGGPVAPVPAGPPAKAVLFVANDDEGSLREEDTTIAAMPNDPSGQAREILRALVARYQQEDSTHPLGAGSDIAEVYLGAAGIAVVDVNANFAAHHRSGILVEDLTLASMARTLAANLPSVTSLKLLVNGKEQPTLAGHADLMEPYLVTQAARLVK